MNIIKDDIRIQLIDKNEAFNILEKVNSEEQSNIQRPLRKWWVDSLVSEMRQGRFLPGVAKLHLVIYGNETYLVNGQHTLRAILLSEKAQKIPVQYTTVANFQDVKDHYAKYDHGLTRSFKDTLRAFNVPDITNLSLHQLQQLAGGMIWIHSRFGNKKVMSKTYSDDDTVRVCFSWADIYKKMMHSICGGEKLVTQTIKNRTVLSVGLATFFSNPDLAEVFWSQVANDNGLIKDDPRKKLHKWLLVSKFHSGSERGYSQVDISRATAFAWNMFATGKTIKRFSFSKSNDFYLEKVELDRIYSDLDLIWSLQ